MVPLQVVIDSPPASLASSSSGEGGQGQGQGPVVVVPPPGNGGVEIGGLPPSFEELAADEFLRGRVLNVLPAAAGDGGEEDGRGRELGLGVGGEAQGAGVDWGGLPEYGEVGYRRVE